MISRLSIRLCSQYVNVVLVNKIDTLKAFDFDMQKFTNHVKELNPNAIIMPISAKTGEGMEQFVTWLADERKKLTEKYS